MPKAVTRDFEIPLSCRGRGPSTSALALHELRLENGAEFISMAGKLCKRPKKTLKWPRGKPSNAGKEVSRGREGYKNKGKPIGAMPDRTGCHGRWPRQLLKLFLLSHFFFFGILSDDTTFSWSGLLLASLTLDRPSGCLLLVWTPFSPWLFFSNFVFWWCHFLSIWFALVISESWRALSCWQLWNLGPDALSLLTNFFPYSLHSPCLFPSLLSSLPQFLHIPTLVTSLLLSLSVLSSLAYYSLQFPAPCTSPLTSCPQSLDFPSLFTSLTCLYFFTLQFPILVSSLLFVRSSPMNLFTSLSPHFT